MLNDTSQLSRSCFPVRFSDGSTPISTADAFHNSDAVATDIIHQHSGRLDYYKGYANTRIIFLRVTLLILACLGTSPNSILQKRSEIGICARNTRRKWSIVNICRLSSTDGGTTRIVLRKHSPRSKYSRRRVLRFLPTES